jgi:PAS domain S-box-containing protein
MEDGLTKSGIGAVGDIPWGTHFRHYYQNKKDTLDVLVPYFKAGLEQNEFCIWLVFDPLDPQEARNGLDSALPGASARIGAGDIEIVPQSQWCRQDGTVDLQQLVRDWQEKLKRALARGYAGMRVNVNSVWLPEEFSALIDGQRIIMLCSYPLAIDSAAETPELRQARAEVKHLQAELAASEIRSRCYFELGLVGMAMVSPTGGCIEVNDPLCSMLGYERPELMRMTWAALVHPDDLAIDVRNYERMAAGEVDGYQIEKRWIRKDGVVFRSTSSLKCQRREDGSIDFFALMVQGVTGLGPSSAGGTAGDSDLRQGTQALSARELEVMRLIGFGRTVKEIAAGLALSEKTVSTYRTRILTKLGLKSTAELIRYALKNRLVD